jgi:hypothetical protein
VTQPRKQYQSPALPPLGAPAPAAVAPLAAACWAACWAARWAAHWAARWAACRAAAGAPAGAALTPAVTGAAAARPAAAAPAVIATPVPASGRGSVGGWVSDKAEPQRQQVKLQGCLLSAAAPRGLHTPVTPAMVPVITPAASSSGQQPSEQGMHCCCCHSMQWPQAFLSRYL